MKEQRFARGDGFPYGPGVLDRRHCQAKERGDPHPPPRKAVRSELPGPTTISQRVPSQCSISGSIVPLSKKCPTTHTFSGERAATPLRLPERLSPGCERTCHVAPFHCSSSSLFCPLFEVLPTAQALVGERTATPFKAPFTLFFPAVMMVQLAPSQCSMSGIV